MGNGAESDVIGVYWMYAAAEFKSQAEGSVFPDAEGKWNSRLEAA